MTRSGRIRGPLDAEEKAAWERVKATVRPLHTARKAPPPPVTEASPPPPPKPMKRPAKTAAPIKAKATPAPAPIPAPGLDSPGLDSHWDRRLKRGAMVPDFTLDLHGMGVGQAYDRLDQALEQAVLTGARAILLVTGRAREHDRASGTGRGAIRAAVHDWLAASRHARHISAVRNAHPRHGGEGALYIILKKGR